MNAGIFKAYDIRGIYPTDINEEDAFKIAQAYIEVLKPKTVALGKDVRLSSPAMWEATKEGLIKAGVNVVDIGTISTDMLYFAVAHYGYDGGISITASHNPKEWTGMKLLGKNSTPIYGAYLLPEIQQLATDPAFEKIEKAEGVLSKQEILADYITKVRSVVNVGMLPKLKVLINANFGLAGVVIKKILADSLIEWVELNCAPDGNFPKGRPDPLVPENREETRNLIKESGAQLGFAWDADADRCFVYDEQGNDVEGCFLGALLAKIMLSKSSQPGEKIIYDPRITWVLKETIETGGGTPVMEKAGHTFFKARMKKEDALAAFECSGHFYFRDFFHCDNGMIPALLILSYLGEKKTNISEAFAEILKKYFVSGEINFTAENKDEIIDHLREKYSDAKFEEIDGISIEYPDWRFNVRKSNTEPLLRLNIETRSQELLTQKKEELVKLIDGLKK